MEGRGMRAAFNPASFSLVFGSKANDHRLESSYSPSLCLTLYGFNVKNDDIFLLLHVDNLNTSFFTILRKILQQLYLIFLSKECVHL